MLQVTTLDGVSDTPFLRSEVTIQSSTDVPTFLWDQQLQKPSTSAMPSWSSSHVPLMSDDSSQSVGFGALALEWPSTTPPAIPMLQSVSEKPHRAWHSRSFADTMEPSSGPKRSKSKGKKRVVGNAMQSYRHCNEKAPNMRRQSQNGVEHPTPSQTFDPLVCRLEAASGRTGRTSGVSNGTLCKQRFDHLDSFKRHLCNDHDIPKGHGNSTTPYICGWEGCEKTGTLSTYHRHLQSHAFRWHCPFPDCLKSYTRGDTFRNHIRDRHYGNVP
ncbi:hypothetical protein CPB83DRAFT_60077 [Crepidotus variabilis]|uniref:C2H2-type domain-containing protein n=1 Tax=Crepidotus variabilis TaxID=179855 RepID=A0A9P6JJF0_9AGAR|nr:hypothetical protein CPB83DRAFT_60077 [Crepidotus variabilis]